MNVTCPECRSVFRVDPGKVPTVGVRARCSVCGGIITIGGGLTVDEEFASPLEATENAAPTAPAALRTVLPTQAEPASRESPTVPGVPASEVADAAMSAAPPMPSPASAPAVVAPAPSAGSGARPIRPESLAAPVAGSGSPEDAMRVVPEAPEAASPVAASPALSPTPATSTPATDAWATAPVVDDDRLSPATPDAQPTPAPPARTPTSVPLRPTVVPPGAHRPFVPPMRPPTPGPATGPSPSFGRPSSGIIVGPGARVPQPPVRPSIPVRPAAPPAGGAGGRTTPASHAAKPAVSPVRPALSTQTTPPVSQEPASPHRQTVPVMRSSLGEPEAPASQASAASATPTVSQPPAASRSPSGTPTRLPINPFLANDPNAKARRLARALISDLVTYFPQKREEGLRNGTTKELFREEIRKSYEEFVEQVGKELAGSTQHFQDALNDILGGGQKIF